MRVYLKFLCPLLSAVDGYSLHLRRTSKNTEVGNTRESGRHIRSLNAGPTTYESVPALPADEELVDSTLDSAHEIDITASERNTAEAAAKAAEAHARAMKAESEAAEASANAQVYLRRAQRAAHLAQDDQVRAFNAAKAIRVYMGEMDGIAKAAADQAVADVMRDAIKDLHGEVQRTIKQYEAQKEADYERAGKQAIESSAPYVTAKWRAKKSVGEYLSRARELANAVTALKGEAVKIATLANDYQKVGNVVVAQQEMMKAHSLMDNALQYQAQAEGFQKQAEKVQGNMGLYDLAAKSAATYAVHVANPSGAALKIPAPPDLGG